MPLQKQSLRETAAQVIRRHIRVAGLRPGQMLPTDRDLSQGLAVSRTVVREALAMLEAEGLVTRRPSVGYFVASGVDSLPPDPSPLDYERLTQAAEARASLELGAAHIILPRITAGELDDLEQAARKLDQAMEERCGHAGAELDFHLAFLATAHNLTILTAGAQLIGDYFRILALARADAFTNPLDIGASQHLPIVTVLRTRDMAIVEPVLLDHYRLPPLLGRVPGA